MMLTDNEYRKRQDRLRFWKGFLQGAIYALIVVSLTAIFLTMRHFSAGTTFF